MPNTAIKKRWQKHTSCFWSSKMTWMKSTFIHQNRIEKIFFLHYQWITHTLNDATLWQVPSPAVFSVDDCSVYKSKEVMFLWTCVWMHKWACHQQNQQKTPSLCCNPVALWLVWGFLKRSVGWVERSLPWTLRPGNTKSRSHSQAGQRSQNS